MCDLMQADIDKRREDRRNLVRENQTLRETLDAQQFLLNLDVHLIRLLVHRMDDMRAHVEGAAWERICGYAEDEDAQTLRALLLQRAWEAPDLTDSLQIIEVLTRLESSQEMEHS